MDSEGLPLQSEDHNNSRKISRAVYSAAFVVGLAICPNAMDQSITAQRQISGKLRLCDNPSLAQTMTLPVEALEIEVLQLSPVDRARLLDRVVASLDAESSRDAAWDAVAGRRDAEIEAGLATEVPVDEVLARLRAALQ